MLNRILLCNLFTITLGVCSLLSDHSRLSIRVVAALFEPDGSGSEEKLSLFSFGIQEVILLGCDNGQ